MGNAFRGEADYYREGDWNAVCSMCGAKQKASKLVKNWQGMYRCPEHNEARNPQDFVRGVADVAVPAWVQPPSSVYLQICTLEGRSAIPGLSVPGCMIPGLFVEQVAYFA